MKSIQRINVDKILQVNQNKHSCITMQEIKVNLKQNVIQLKKIIIDFFVFCKLLLALTSLSALFLWPCVIY